MRCNAIFILAEGTKIAFRWLQTNRICVVLFGAIETQSCTYLNDIGCCIIYGNMKDFPAESLSLKWKIRPHWWNVKRIIEGMMVMVSENMEQQKKTANCQRDNVRLTIFVEQQCRLRIRAHYKPVLGWRSQLPIISAQLFQISATILDKFPISGNCLFCYSSYKPLF